MNIENALRFIRPEPKFHGRLFTQDDYENKILWVDSRPKPTWAEIVQADIDFQAFLATEAAARQQELLDLAALRTEYSLTDWTTIKGKDVKQAAKDQVSRAGGIPQAIEQLTIAIALLEKKLYGQL